MKKIVFAVGLILSLAVLFVAAVIFMEASSAQARGSLEYARTLANLGICTLILSVVGFAGTFLSLKYRWASALLLGLGLCLMIMGCFTIYSSLSALFLGMAFVVLALFVREKTLST